VLSRRGCAGRWDCRIFSLICNLPGVLSASSSVPGSTPTWLGAGSDGRAGRNGGGGGRGGSNGGGSGGAGG